jgi:hypothetical protein
VNRNWLENRVSEHGNFDAVIHRPKEPAAIHRVIAAIANKVDAGNQLARHITRRSETVRREARQVVSGARLRGNDDIRLQRFDEEE